MNGLDTKMKSQGSKKGLVGAILAAAAASACCIGPLVAIGFGVGGAWASSFSIFESIRPYLFTVTAGFLTYSFYNIYWKAKTEVCEPGTVCANLRTDKINKVSLWTVTILVITMFSVPYLTPKLYAQTKETIKMNTKTVTLDVSGMTCSSCEFAFVKGTSLVVGVTDVKADYEAGHAVVSFDSSKVSLDQLLIGTEKIGYKSALKSK